MTEAASVGTRALQKQVHTVVTQFELRYDYGEIVELERPHDNAKLDRIFGISTQPRWIVIDCARGSQASRGGRRQQRP